MAGRLKSVIAKPIRYDDALITSIVAYQEADCIVRLFSRQAGFTTAFYKRGLWGKKGLIQSPALARVGLVEGSQKLARLTSCDLDPLITGAQCFSLRAFGYGSYLAELIEKFMPEGECAPEVFSLIEESFHLLSQNRADACLLRSFELKLLEYCGYLPEMPSLPIEHNLAFDPIACRFVDTMNERSFHFSKAAILLAKSMLIAKLGSVNYEGLEELMMIGRIFQSRLKLMGFAPLKSVLFLKQLSRR